MEKKKTEPNADDLAKYILIGFGKIPLLEQRPPTEEEMRTVRVILNKFGAVFMEWLYDNNYMRPRNIAGVINWDRIMEEFFRDTGFIRSTKCRTCKEAAYEVDPGKFYCTGCGSIFNEDECPKCGRKMDGPHHPQEGEGKFTPFWTCPCGYTTEAAT